MKFCKKCGVEIDETDSKVICTKCLDITRKRIHSNALKRERGQVMRDLGLTKVKGGLGGTYWE